MAQNSENNMKIEVLGKTHVVGLEDHSLRSFQDLMDSTIAWDKQVKAEYGASYKNTLLLELPIRIRRFIRIEELDANLDTQIDFELIYQQDINRLTSSLAQGTQYFLSVQGQEIDMRSIDTDLLFLDSRDRNNLKHLMRNCDEIFYAWVREVKTYLQRLTEQQLCEKLQSKIKSIVGTPTMVPKTFSMI